MGIRTLIVVACMFIATSLFAQANGIECTRLKNQKIKFLKEGSKARVRHGMLTSRGRLVVLSDSSIAINTDTIPFGHVNEIRVRSTGNQIAGGTLALAGGYVLAGSIAGITGFAAELGALGTLIGIALFAPLGAGGALIAGTGVVFLTKGKKYSKSKWGLRIVNTEAKPDPGS